MPLAISELWDLIERGDHPGPADRAVADPTRPAPDRPAHRCDGEAMRHS